MLKFNLISKSELMEMEFSSENKTDLATNKSVRKRGRPKKKKVISQKRIVEAVKVFMTPEEKLELQKRSAGFKSLSNYIRYHLGLGLNEPGRKRRHFEPAFELDLPGEF